METSNRANAQQVTNLQATANQQFNPMPIKPCVVFLVLDWERAVKAGFYEAEGAWRWIREAADSERLDHRERCLTVMRLEVK